MSQGLGGVAEIVAYDTGVEFYIILPHEQQTKTTCPEQRFTSKTSRSEPRQLRPSKYLNVCTRLLPPPLSTVGYYDSALSVYDEEHPNYIQGLSGCLRKVPSMIACEAAYMFPTDIDLCPAGETKQGRSFAGGERGEQWGEERVERRDNEEVVVEGQDDGSSGGDAETSLRGARGVTGAGNATLGTDHEKEDRRDDLAVKDDQQARATDGTDDEEEEEGAGNLVVHVRSGDIFVDPVHPGYGQVRMTHMLKVVFFCETHALFRRFPCILTSILLSRGRKPTVSIVYERTSHFSLAPFTSKAQQIFHQTTWHNKPALTIFMPPLPFTCPSRL